LTGGRWYTRVQYTRARGSSQVCAARPRFPRQVRGEHPRRCQRGQARWAYTRADRAGTRLWTRGSIESEELALWPWHYEDQRCRLRSLQVSRNCLLPELDGLGLPPLSVPSLRAAPTVPLKLGGGAPRSAARSFIRRPRRRCHCGAGLPSFHSAARWPSSESAQERAAVPAPGGPLPPPPGRCAAGSDGATGPSGPRPHWQSLSRSESPARRRNGHSSYDDGDPRHARSLRVTEWHETRRATQLVTQVERAGIMMATPRRFFPEMVGLFPQSMSRRSPTTKSNSDSESGWPTVAGAATVGESETQAGVQTACAGQAGTRRI
jgi:hypothetical protein